MITTRLTERFGTQHPIVCAPMAYVAGGALAAAVSRAGGLGMVAGGYAGTVGGEPDLESEIAQAKSGKFGVGFILWALERAPQLLTTALQHSPFCVFLSFGDPRPFASKIAKAGAVLVCQVQFLSQIDLALEAGAAAVVVQETEAGGHGATRSTLPFVSEAANYLKQHSPETLLLAAGGIADGRGLAAALMLGADGVVVGTRLWASAEASTPEAHTDKAFAVTGDSTIRTKVLDALRGVPWPREYSYRFLKNRLSDEWANREAEAFRTGAVYTCPSPSPRSLGEGGMRESRKGEGYSPRDRTCKEIEAGFPKSKGANMMNSKLQAAIDELERLCTTIRGFKERNGTMPHPDSDAGRALITLETFASELHKLNLETILSRKI